MGETEVVKFANPIPIMTFEFGLKKDVFFKIYKNYTGFYQRDCTWVTYNAHGPLV